MKSLKDFNYLLSLDRRYTKTESEIFRLKTGDSAGIAFKNRDASPEGGRTAASVRGSPEDHQPR